MAFVDLVECTTSYNIRSNRDNNDIGDDLSNPVP